MVNVGQKTLVNEASIWGWRNYLRALPVGRWMSRSNGNLAIFDENHVPVIYACLSPSFAPRHFHCRTCYSTGHCCALNLLQQSRVKIYNGHGGRDKEVTKVRKDVHSSTGGSQIGTQRSCDFRKHCLQLVAYGYSENWLPCLASHCDWIVKFILLIFCEWFSGM